MKILNIRELQIVAYLKLFMAIEFVQTCIFERFQTKYVFSFILHFNEESVEFYFIVLLLLLRYKFYFK